MTMLARKLEAVAAPPPDEQVAADSPSTADAALIACCINTSAADRQRIQSCYLPSDLADPKARFIDGVIKSMDAAGIAVSPITIIEYVASGALVGPGLPRVQLATWVHDAVASAPPASVAEWLADRVVEHSIRRQLSSALDRVQKVAAEGSLADLAAATLTELESASEALRRLAGDAE